MPAGIKRRTPRRQPKQRRALQTVEAVLDAAVRILQREGPHALNTNRIAEVAGVSIGSVYQYFPDKGAIFAALHQRHIDEIDRVIAKTFLAHATSTLPELIRALVDTMVDAHTPYGELYDLLFREVRHHAGNSQDFAVRLHGAFRQAISSRQRRSKKHQDLDKAAFIVANLVDSLSHAVVLRRLPSLPLPAAKHEAVRAILAYLGTDPPRIASTVNRMPSS
jgi:AcrR family transcriptional regulator